MLTRRVVVALAAVLVSVAAWMPPAGAAALTWTRESTPAPHLPSGRPEAVSCPADGPCMAVGSFVDPSGRTTPYAQQWVGATWTDTAAVVPAGAVAAQLISVSCVAGDRCVAVGYTDFSTGPERTLAEVWDGSSWRIVATPSPGLGTHGAYASLLGVSCWAADGCMAVGDYTPTSPNRSSTLTEVWDGTRWTVVASPNTKSATYTDLIGVSCYAAYACAAVGSFHLTGQSDEKAFSVSWNGIRWHITPTDRPGGPSRLESVSCATSDLCVGVGSTGTETGVHHTLVEQFDGVRWTRVASPDHPGSESSQLFGVACTVNGCVAVGNGYTPGTRTLTLAESWDGTRWRVRSSPNPPTGYTGLSAVSCRTLSDCLAVGVNGARRGPTRPFAAWWTGAAWSPLLGPVGGEADVFSPLRAISCATTIACVAVGSTIDADGRIVPFAEVRSGGSWSATPVAAPVGNQSELDSVSCTAATSCVAVGTRTEGTTAAPRTHPIAAMWDGADWTSLSVLDVAGLDRWTGVSCTVAGDCVAVGWTHTTTGDRATAAHWDGTSWTALRLPPSGDGTRFAGVSCAAVDDCVAVGRDVPAGQAPQVLRAHWNGVRWAVQTDPTGDGLTAVSCASATFCAAVGNDASVGGGVSDIWNGSAWSQGPLGQPANGTPDLRAVSCTSAARCVAAGGKVRTAVWNGAAWVLGQAVAPTDGIVELDGISCPTADVCRVSGIAAPQPLVETTG